MIPPSGEQITIAARDQEAVVVEVGGDSAHTLWAAGSLSTDIEPTR